MFQEYLLWRAAGGRPALPPWKELLALIALGLVTQLGGVLLVWSMGVVGVAITGTLQMGVMLAASAVLGRIVLGNGFPGDRLRRLHNHRLGGVFQQGGPIGRGGRVGPHCVEWSERCRANGAAAPQRILLGIAASVLAGLAFAALTVGIRKTVAAQPRPRPLYF